MWTFQTQTHQHSFPSPGQHLTLTNWALHPQSSVGEHLIIFSSYFGLGGAFQCIPKTKKCIFFIFLFKLIIRRRAKLSEFFLSSYPVSDNTFSFLHIFLIRLFWNLFWKIVRDWELQTNVLWLCVNPLDPLDHVLSLQTVGVRLVRELVPLSGITLSHLGASARTWHELRWVVLYIDLSWSVWCWELLGGLEDWFFLTWLSLGWYYSIHCLYQDNYGAISDNPPMHKSQMSE